MLLLLWIVYLQVYVNITYSNSKDGEITATVDVTPTPISASIS
jgi:hypothetical protein